MKTDNTHTHTFNFKTLSVNSASKEETHGKILLLNRLDLIIFKKHISIYL